MRLVPIERNVFQPRVQRLEGAEAVLQYLKRSGESNALVVAAGQMMRGPRPEEERTFDAVEGEWIPGEPSAHRETSRPSALPPGHASDLAELRAEHLVLRASYERLRERVQKLESQNARGASKHDVLSVPPTPALSMPRLADVPAKLEPPVAISTTSKVADLLPERTFAQGTLKLPDAAAINACLQNLIGESSALRAKHPVKFAPEELGACWVTRLIDGTGAEIGAIVADRAATTTLGGALMALPEHEVEAQRTRVAPTQDVIGAMSEVANQLCETMNQETAGVHVRIKPIEALLPGLLDWTDTAAAALELELDLGFGRLFLFAR